MIFSITYVERVALDGEGAGLILKIQVANKYNMVE
jgi:hypothetical protein